MTQVVSILGGAVIAESHGALDAGVSVVALHGWGRTRDDFRALATAMPRSLALDLPGFGASPPPDIGWGAREYADRIADSVEPFVERDGPVVIVGHSFGGRVATCLAARRPDLVRGLLLMGVPLIRPNPHRPSATFRLARAANRWRLYSDRRMQRLRHRKGSADYRAAEGVMRDVLVRVVNEDYRDELLELRCPTALLWGEHDSAAPVVHARTASDLVDNLIEFCVVDAGHDVHVTHPAEVQRLVHLLDASRPA